MFSLFLNIGCSLDWITPAIAFIQDLSEPVSDFGIPASPYWTRRKIKRLLRNHGIKVWGLIYNFSGNVLMFTVPRQQGEVTYYLLQTVGIPILYATVETLETLERDNDLSDWIAAD